jgi:hypothetical protein
MPNQSLSRSTVYDFGSDEIDLKLTEQALRNVTTGHVAGRDKGPLPANGAGWHRDTLHRPTTRHTHLKNGVFEDVTPRFSYKNRRFGGT